MSASPSDVIAWMLVLSLAGMAILAAWAIVSWLWTRLRGPELIPAASATRWPALYLGCLTCEAARGVSVHSLVRHQERDHTGGVRW